MNSDDAIRRANSAFYQAFLDRDLAAMDRMWALRLPVLCVHPGATPLATREQVLASWHDILANPRSPILEHRVETILHFGDIALLTCYEWSKAQPDAALVATNGFALENGVYKMILHHAGPVHSSAVHGSAVPGTTPPKPRIH
ncbi:MAG: nuclear transport factor 2 family protein [Gammaproteobacteria bacterium]